MTSHLVTGQPRNCRHMPNGQVQADLRSGYLVCLEGIDGSGKSTIAYCISEQLTSLGLRSTLVNRKQVSGCPEFVESRLRSMTEMLWDYPEDAPVHQLGDHHLIHLLVSWFHLFDKWVLRPHLMTPQVVLVDTWFYKYVARFMLKPEFFGTSVQSWFNGLTTPNIIFWLSTDPATAWHRKGKARETELRARGCNNQDERSRFIEYQTRVQDSLGEIAKCDRWKRINASPPAHEVTTAAVDAILNSFALTGSQSPILIDRANPDHPVFEGNSRSKLDATPRCSGNTNGASGGTN